MKKVSIIFLSTVLLMVLLFIVNIFFGSIDISVRDVLDAVIGKSANSIASFIVVQSRLPQAITALLCGASLAVSGLMLQTVFQNPLADPSILGVNSGASLGVAVVMLLFGGSVVTMGTAIGGFLLIVIAAFIGSFAIIALLLFFARYVKNNLTLLIVGIMISYVASSAISLLNFCSTEQGVHSYVMWGLGNFGGVGPKCLPMFCTALLLCIAFSVMLIKPLNALLLGTNYAENLGINIQHTRTWLLAITGLISAIVTAFCGPISFLGLAVPHMARIVGKTADHRILLPLTLLIGACLGLLCNWLCALPSDGTLIPLNVVTPFFGVPVILYVLLKRK